MILTMLRIKLQNIYERFLYWTAVKVFRFPEIKDIKWEEE